jgi:hypothetical protein
LRFNYGRTLARAGLGICAALAVFHGTAGYAKEALPFCASARDTLAKDAGLRDAVSAVFGANPAYLPQSDERRACMFPVAVLEYPDAHVLITASIPAGEVSPVTVARLSAYFLRPVDGGFRLVTVRRDFADGGRAMGNVGPVTAIRYGNDEGMMVEGYSTGQGYDYGSVSLYLFRKEGVVALGTIPTRYGDGGAVEEAKETDIDGKVEVGQPQPDQVRVTYSIRRAGKPGQQTVIWRSEDGKFIPVSGSVPADLVP